MPAQTLCLILRDLSDVKLMRNRVKTRKSQRNVMLFSTHSNVRTSIAPATCVRRGPSRQATRRVPAKELAGLLSGTSLSRSMAEARWWSFQVSRHSVCSTAVVARRRCNSLGSLQRRYKKNRLVLALKDKWIRCLWVFFSSS